MPESRALSKFSDHFSPYIPLSVHPPQQRRAILKRLRILARVAIRSYMREQAEQAQAGQDEGVEAS